MCIRDSLQAAAVLTAGTAPEVCNLHQDLAISLFSSTCYLQNLRERHGLVVSGQSAARLQKEQLQLNHPFQNQFGSYELVF